MTTKAKNKAAAVVVTLSSADTKATVKVINAAAESAEAAIHSLAVLSDKYPTVQAKQIAAALVTAGAKWADATIQQELGRIRKLKREGLYRADMTTNEMRDELRMLKAVKDADTAPIDATTGDMAVPADASKAATRISRNAPDTIAAALVDALIASGVGDMEAVLAEARRLVIAAVNAKKSTK